MSPQWQISAGELFEWMRPAAWTISALISAGVLRSSYRRGFKPHWVAAWTLGALFFPLIVLPLYLIALARARGGRPVPESHQTPGPTEQATDVPPARASHRAWTRTLPVLYLVLVLSFIALFLYRDYGSVDAHLWRANNAKLRGPRSKVISEYRAALRLEDDAHTHKLLAIELAADGRAEEALAEFRAAERGGEPDKQIPFHVGALLETLGRKQEAALEYDRFLGSTLCTQALPDYFCASARARLKSIRAAPAR